MHQHEHSPELPDVPEQTGRAGFLRWPCLLMCLPAMILAGGVGGLLVGGTVLYAGARWGTGSETHVTRFGVPLLVAAGGLLLFLVCAGVAETLIAGGSGGAP